MGTNVKGKRGIPIIKKCAKDHIFYILRAVFAFRADALVRLMSEPRAIATGPVGSKAPQHPQAI